MCRLVCVFFYIIVDYKNKKDVSLWNLLSIHEKNDISHK